MEQVRRRLDTLQELELADGVEIRLRIVGPLLRGMAFLLDVLFVLLLFGGMSLIAFLFSSVLGGFVGAGVAQLLYFLIAWFYFSILEAGKKGATWGKRALGIRVAQNGGMRITLSQALIRGFIRPIELVVPLVALVPLFNRKCQRLGDMVAGTVVVYAREVAEPVIPGPSPLAAVPVPVPLSREERGMILKFRDRSGSWSEGRRLELVEHLKPLTKREGLENVGMVLGMARWLDEKK